MRFLITFALIAVSVLQADHDPEYDLSDGVLIEADNRCSNIDSSIYYMTLGEYAEPRLRVSLSSWWGDYEIYLDEIWYDEIEGNPYHGDSYCLSGSVINDILREGTGFEFVKWIDETTFELQTCYYREFHYIVVEYMGDGFFNIYKSNVYYSNNQ
jgi:hypothetical protein